MKGDGIARFDTSLPPEVQRERDEKQRAAGLRDWFAGQALPTVIESHGGSCDDSARTAYAYADAMLVARVRQ